MKAIRLSEKEEQVINEFLERNPFFDFSSLARTALLAFIENPQLNLIPVKHQFTEKEAGRGKQSRTSRT